MLLRATVTRPERSNMYWKELIRQMNDIGVGSVMIIAIISVFLGAVTAVQTAYQIFGNALVPGYYLGWIVRDTTILELAPTISCLILAGKVGSNIASELGNMRISEQIDALEIMGVNTEAYLVGPRVLGGLIVVPMLIVLAAFLMMMGGYVATLGAEYVSGEEYIRGLLVSFNEYNITLMLVKAAVFSFLITTVSCYQGYFVNGGSIELGSASTRAVVFSSILILLFDYLLAILLL